MTPEQRLLISAVLIPMVGILLIVFSSRWRNLRETFSLLTAVTLFVTVIRLTVAYNHGADLSIVLLEPFPSLRLALKAEPLGLVFGLVASGLWIVTTFYSIGYMRGNDERHQTRYYAFFAAAIFAAMGLTLSANMLTLFVFYEVLTVSTYPLVAHKGNEKARAGARVYLGVLLTSSILLLLPAMIWTWKIAGTLDFTPGGILAGKAKPEVVLPLLALYMFGVGKAALMPFHRWLPAAMVAPTPVSALLHAVAVVKAGVFTVLKVTVYLFGPEFLSQTGASDPIMYAAAFTLLMASIVALTKDNLKARLAYSTISQLSYIVLGAMLASTMGVLGGGLHLVMHAMGKITLFFCAGAIYTAVHKTEISDMNGLGRTMPFTYAAFFIGSLSIIGLPPFGGAWSKWYLMLGSAEAGHAAMILVLLISSLLNIAYLLPVVARGFFLPPADADSAKAKGGSFWANVKEAPFFCVAPPCLTAAGCLILFLFAEPIIQFLEPIAIK